MSRKEPVRLEDWRKQQDDAVKERIESNHIKDVEALISKCKIKAKTKNQEKYLNCIDKHIITLCAGCAGTGKTFVAVSKALEYLFLGKVEQIILTRPLLECDEELGFLPGDIGEKTLPYMLPLFDVVDKIVGKGVLTKLINKEQIIVSPLAYMRGRNFDKSFLILDEAQNATYAQLKMFLTRFEGNSKIVVCGDVSQSDVKEEKHNPFAEVANRLRGNPNISRVLFTREDIVRHPLIQWIDERL